jgi:hypothetical protein
MLVCVRMGEDFFVCVWQLEAVRGVWLAAPKMRVWVGKGGGIKKNRPARNQNIPLKNYVSRTQTRRRAGSES